jgi:hypothetical protein
MPIEIDLNSRLAAGSPYFCGVLRQLVDGHGDIVDDRERTVITGPAK